MDRSEADRLTIVEVITEQNAEAIQKLTLAIEKLSEIVAREDANIRKTLDHLTKTATECQMRHEHFMTTLQEKKETLIIVQRKLDKKASIEEVQAIRRAMLKVMWWVLGGVLSVAGAAILYYIQGANHG